MNKIQILYENHVKSSHFMPGWGFAALLTVGDRKVLFDTGADVLVLRNNASALHVDFNEIDALVLSHHHCDHIGAISPVRHANLDVHCTTSLPQDVQDSIIKAGGTVHVAASPGQIVPGVITTGEMGDEICEQGLVLDVPSGPILITGCAHPGIDNMASVATSLLGRPLDLVLGGFHLLRESDEHVQVIASKLKDLGIRQIAPCHCTGKRASDLLKKAYGGHRLDICTGVELLF